MARADLIGWDPKASQNWPSKMRSGIAHHKSDHKSCVLPTADRNSLYRQLNQEIMAILTPKVKI